MKKFFLSLAVVATIVVSMSSCKKCVKCKLLLVTFDEVCEKDFASTADYEAAIQTLKDNNAGLVCK